MNTQKQRTIELHWKHGKVDVITGPDKGDRFETVANAMNETGIGAGALAALDYWKILPVAEADQIQHKIEVKK